MTKFRFLRFLPGWLPALVVIGLTACGGANPTPTEAIPELPTATSLTAAAPTAPPAPTPSPAAADGSEAPLQSGNPDLDFAQVQFVRATYTGENIWRFDVTVRHNDQGWDHYADLWRVVDPGGNVLGERVLLHPHDTEQPFTRSQSGIEIPPAVTQVRVQAKCNVHGFGGQEVPVDLTVGEGENFTVAH